MMPVSAPPPAITTEERHLLLQVAREALRRVFALAVDDVIDVSEAGRTHPALRVPRAVFVTLWRRDTGELRGCRGESTPSRPLVEAVADMTCAAAFDDPRFAPVTDGELPRLQLEISVLSPLHPIPPGDVEPGRHGLLIVAGRSRGLLLPQVALEHGMSRTEFLAALCWKAGLPEDAWQRPGVELLAFETECWQE